MILDRDTLALLAWALLLGLVGGLLTGAWFA